MCNLNTENNYSTFFSVSQHFGKKWIGYAVVKWSETDWLRNIKNDHRYMKMAKNVKIKLWIVKLKFTRKNENRSYGYKTTREQKHLFIYWNVLKTFHMIMDIPPFTIFPSFNTISNAIYRPDFAA